MGIGRCLNSLKKRFLYVTTAVLLCVVWYNNMHGDYVCEMQASSRWRDRNATSVREMSDASTNTRHVSAADTNKLHVILTFRLINNTEHKLASARMMEYMESLNSSLNNKHVKYVHLMYDSPALADYIQEKLKTQTTYGKLMLHQVDSPDVVLTLHQFAFSHLQGQVVVITQADIILGEGFDKINRDLMKQKRVMYSLSRHPGRKCKRKDDRCKKYHGSHDTYVFVPQGDITASAMCRLDHYVYSLGTERFIMRAYRTSLNYTILNPCNIFKIYHNHCSQFRKYALKQPQLDVNVEELHPPTNRTA